MKIKKDINPEEWEDLLSHSPEATIFHTYESIKVFTETYPEFEALYIIVTNAEQELVGGMPIIRRKHSSFYRLHSMPFGGYGGPILRDGVDEQIRIRILKEFCRLSSKWNNLDSHVVDFSQKCALLSPTFSSRESFTHILNLDLPLQDIWLKKLTKKTRNQIRMSQKRGAKIEEVSLDCLDDVYKMYLETDRRHGRKSSPISFYKNILGMESKNVHVKWLVAKGDDKYIAAIQGITFKGSIGLGSASLEEYRNYYRPNNLLIWELIKWGCENGCTCLNFGGSPPEAKGLINFKESWGAQKYEYIVFDKISPLFTFASFCKGILNRIHLKHA